jgi:hypothetical protein
MTTQQHNTIARIQSQHEAQRFEASQASRAATLATLKANALERAGELALLGRFAESKRVLELSYFNQED